MSRRWGALEGGNAPDNQIASNGHAIQIRRVLSALLLTGICLVGVLLRYDWLVHFLLPMLPSFATCTKPSPVPPVVHLVVGFLKLALSVFSIRSHLVPDWLRGSSSTRYTKTVLSLVLNIYEELRWPDGHLSSVGIQSVTALIHFWTVHLIFDELHQAIELSNRGASRTVLSIPCARKI